ncbi:C40 family peptidase [uncultured Jatrophihabitans sp.]|uniref:C40 family peptidase n=1 Tax=uncultured Jatrophihabitans sp. TaxID=1610747 RepID=UPI0035CC0626
MQRAAAVAAGVACLAAAAMATAGSATANPPGPHDPFGSAKTVVAVPGGVRFTGWSADPDALTTNLKITAVVDGFTTATSTHTSLPNAAVVQKYHTGATPGFALTVPVTGVHTVCAAAASVGAGYSTVLKCVVTPLGTKLTRAQKLAHRPVGAITRSWANPHSLHLFGWTTDPDVVNRHQSVVVYVDGHAAVTATTRAYPRHADPRKRWPSPRPANAGTKSAFNILVRTAVGTHIACVWAVNIGIGSGNSFLGCKAFDNRGRAGAGPVATPKLNAKVVAEAKKHIGQPYVWGATGPKKFDCSGLVVYSYTKFGFTPPRVSENQAFAARLIPASRAVPGDLVFYHDEQGDVYHVGIYLSPGKTVAAIDEQEGVDYQPIWDPTTATYGSFTHT